MFHFSHLNAAYYWQIITHFTFVFHFWIVKCTILTGIIFSHKFFLISLNNGITNNNGTYTTTGVSVSGDTTFTATYSSVTDTVLVEYCDFVDYAVTGKHNTKWWATGTLNITTSSDGTLVKNENSSGYSLDYSYITDNFPSGWSDRENAVTCYTRPFIVEFDLVSVSSTSSVGLYIGNSSANVHTYFTNLGITGTGHVRIEVSTTQVKCYLDETLVSTNNLEDSVTTSRVGFRINAGNNFKYKDFRIRLL